MLSPVHFRRLVLRPVLHHLGLWSAAAENLLLGTAIQESGLRHLERPGIDDGRGVFRILPARADRVRDALANENPVLVARLDGLAAAQPSLPEQLATNLAYATAMARLIYRDAPAPLPPADDIAALGRYWKCWFKPVGDGNDAARRASTAAFVLHYREFVG